MALGIDFDDIISNLGNLPARDGPTVYNDGPGSTDPNGIRRGNRKRKYKSSSKPRSTKQRAAQRGRY